jgi:phosphoribosylformylglycinamidine synthase
VVCVPRKQVVEVTRRAAAAGVAAAALGHAGGDRLVVDGLVDVAVADARAAWTGSLPAKLQLIDT